VASGEGGVVQDFSCLELESDCCFPTFTLEYQSCFKIVPFKFKLCHYGSKGQEYFVYFTPQPNLRDTWEYCESWGRYSRNEIINSLDKYADVCYVCQDGGVDELRGRTAHGEIRPKTWWRRLLSAVR
jgi:hypothetical protein